MNATHWNYVSCEKRKLTNIAFSKLFEIKIFFNKALKEVERKYLQEILGIGKSRFFQLIQSYRENPESFSVEYKRLGQTRSIDPAIKENIIKELAIDKKAIENKDIPLYRYNYSYVQKRLKKVYKQTVALTTVINHAKANGFCLPKRNKPKAHDREVLTNNVGELIQHDASHQTHLCALTPSQRQGWASLRLGSRSSDPYMHPWKCQRYCPCSTRSQCWARPLQLQANSFNHHGNPCQEI